MDLQVQKNEGRLEPFDRNKILSGMVKAGVDSQQAETLSLEVEQWAQTAALDGVVSALQLRGKVLEVLGVNNPQAAVAFESYRKTEPLPEPPEMPPPMPPEPMPEVSPQVPPPSQVSSSPPVEPSSTLPPADPLTSGPDDEKPEV